MGNIVVEMKCLAVESLCGPEIRSWIALQGKFYHNIALREVSV